MKLLLPQKNLLRKTGEVDYYDWNYKFPISLIQKYRFKKIIKLLGEKKYPKMLEIGTGSGIFLPELSKHCDTIYACDIYESYDHIKNLCASYGITQYFVGKQDIESTNYPDNFFDSVIAVSVLEFVHDKQKAINEIKRIMKPDGVFITICPMQSTFLDLFLSMYSNKKPVEEFGDSRTIVTKLIEDNFYIEKKGYMIPLLGKLFPVYTHFVLHK